MCRLRFAGGIVSAHQFRGVADIAEQCGGGYTHATTRANLQIREIKARDSVQRRDGACRTWASSPAGRARTTSGTSRPAPRRASTPRS